MNSNSLEAWQIERLYRRVHSELHFSTALKDGCIRSTSRPTTRFLSASKNRGGDQRAGEPTASIAESRIARFRLCADPDCTRPDRASPTNAVRSSY